MRHLLLRLWHEEDGFAAGPEWALIATILVLGAITGVVAVRHAAPSTAEEPPPALVR
jgi:Flp pilus assembly pilin Flp